MKTVNNRIQLDVNDKQRHFDWNRIFDGLCRSRFQVHFFPLQRLESPILPLATAGSSSYIRTRATERRSKEEEEEASSSDDGPISCLLEFLPSDGGKLASCVVFVQNLKENNLD